MPFSYYCYHHQRAPWFNTHSSLLHCTRILWRMFSCGTLAGNLLSLISSSGCSGYSAKTFFTRFSDLFTSLIESTVSASTESRTPAMTGSGCEFRRSKLAQLPRGVPWSLPPFRSLNLSSRISYCQWMSSVRIPVPPVSCSRTWIARAKDTTKIGHKSSLTFCMTVKLNK